MSGFITAFPTSLKIELPSLIHNFTTGGDVFAIALGIASPSGSYGAATGNYSDLGSDEVAGTGYTAGGFAWTNSQNISPAGSGTSSFWSWSVNPTWSTATFSTSGCIIYNKSKSNKCVYVGSFGGILNVSGIDFTLLLPTNAVGSSILGLD